MNTNRKERAKREPLLKRIESNVPRETNAAQARIKWSNAIKSAKNDAEVARIEKLLNDKLALKTKLENAVQFLPPAEHDKYLKDIMSYKNDVANRTKNLENLTAIKKKKLENEEAARLEAERKAQFEETKKPLFNKIVKEIPGKTGVFRRGWEGLVRKAATKEELNSINAQLNERIKLRNEIRASDISNKEKAAHEAWIMKYGNNVGKRRQELNRQLKAKKNAADALKKNVATKLQALNKLEKANRTAFMNRLNKNGPNKVIANATKMNTNRREKERRDQLRKNTAKLLQNKTKLTRNNRKMFMNRLEKGEDPNAILKEANKLDSNRLTRSGIESKLKQIDGLTQKDVNGFLKRWNTSKNKTIFTEARQLAQNRNNKSLNAKKEIQAMSGMGVKNRNRFVARINKGEDAAKVLKEARERNKKGASSKSKTVKNLEYNQTVKNVVRRL